MMNQPTQFIEANALLVLQRDDESAARESLSDLGDGGIVELEKAARKLVQLCVILPLERKAQGEIERLRREVNDGTDHFYCELCGSKAPTIRPTEFKGCVYQACEVCWSEAE